MLNDFILRMSQNRWQNIRMYFYLNKIPIKPITCDEILFSKHEKISVEITIPQSMSYMPIEDIIISYARANIRLNIIDWSVVHVETETYSFYSKWTITWMDCIVLKKGNGMYKGTLWRTM